MAELTIITNHVPRDIVDAWELTAQEREDFNYIDWAAIERGEDSASFLRYRGDLIDLSEYEVWNNPASPTFGGKWHGVRPDSYFSGTLVRYADDSCETVVVGRYYS